MTLRLKISLAGNVILAGLVLWLVRPHASETARPNVAVPPRLVTPSPATDAVTTADPVPFRWSQLLASDYRVFIQNLRNIGCPECNLRAIVKLDADQAFAFQRRELRVDEREAGPWSWQSEQRLIASLLGEPLPDTEPLTATAAVAQRAPRTWQRPEPEPVLPLIFQPVELAQLNLNEVQKEVLGELQQQFLDEIGGTNQDPSDPAYLARWQAAQTKIDQATRGRLGSPLYIQLRVLASHPAATP